MTERETINSLMAMTEKESALLAAFEACGRVIENMKSDKMVADIRIKNLENRVEDLQGIIVDLETELAKVKGGRNEW